MPPGVGTIDLAEAVEHLFDVRRRDADAVVGDVKQKASVRGNLGRSRHLAARGREFHRIAKQIEEDLPAGALVGQNRAQAGSHMLSQGQAPAMCPLLDHAHGRLDDLRDIAGSFVELEAAGLDLRGVENAVDDAQQVLAAIPDVPRVLEILVRTDRPIELPANDLGEPEDRVQGGAQLMAHVGQELALGVVREFGLLLGPHQFLFRVFLLCKVERDTPDGDHSAVGVFDRKFHGISPFTAPTREVNLLGHAATGLDDLAIHRLRDRGPGARRYFTGAPPENVCCRPVPYLFDRTADHDVAALDILHHHFDRRVLHEAAESRLTRLERKFRLLLVADINRDTADGDDTPGGVLDRELHLVVPSFTQVGKVHLPCHGPAGFDDLAVHRLYDVDAGAFREVADAPTQDLRGRFSPHRLDAAVDHLKPPLDVLHQHDGERVADSIDALDPMAQTLADPLLAHHGRKAARHGSSVLERFRKKSSEACAPSVAA